MKLRGLMPLLLAARLLAGDETSPSIELFAGWGWYPFSDDGFPACHRRYPYGYPMPAAVLSLPLCGTGRDGFPSPGWYGYTPYWGFSYGTRLALREPAVWPALPPERLAGPPGSAPLQPRQTLSESLWNADIERLLSGADLHAFSRLVPATNAPSRPESAAGTAALTPAGKQASR